MVRLVIMLVMVMAASDCVTTDVQPDVRNYDLFTPIHENCTRSLMELLLLRQEIRLNQLIETEKESAATLATVAQLLTEVKDAIISKPKQESEDFHSEVCTAPFSRVGKTCLLLALGHQVTWAAARQYCSARSGDLATFSDANTYAEYLGYVNVVNKENAAVSIWIGGSDEAEEGVWTWITGELMPRGPPFWGSIDGYRAEPGGGRGENCCFLFHSDKYYLHDGHCVNVKAAPLCQKVYN
ncbi:hypothetical protein OTU49_006936 [Cherax quadricarinatus]|uniref:C-type lectin domain-containing protein n=2 Tax=Cherax quadricarinatus TaxID=27406 RepID=A0AAW0WL04_CHEQU|nr:ladderlectin-like [Cherax quadricarinatus]